MFSSCNTIYCDASFHNNEAGIACLALNKSGDIIDIKTSKKKATTPIEAELLAILKATYMASNITTSKEENVVIFTDNLSAANFINRNNKCSKKYLNIVRRIQNQENISIKWIDREQNKKADALAVFASRRK